MRVGNRFLNKTTNRTFTIIQIEEDGLQIKYTSSGNITWITKQACDNCLQVSESYSTLTDKYILAVSEVYRKSNRKYLEAFIKLIVNKDRSSLKSIVKYVKVLAYDLNIGDWKSMFYFIKNYVQAKQEALL